MANVTIRDVAKEAGVAVETVSRVLNNRGYISQKTRDKVYSAMQRIGYVPNAFAQGLSRKKMDCIAVIVPNILHPYFSAVISHLEHEASRRGYKVFIYSSGGDGQKESDLLRVCQSSFVSGVLLFSADVSAKTLTNLQIPVVLVERTPVGNTVNVQCDNAGGGSLAAKHLIEKGCRRLLVLGTTSSADMPGDSRYREFVRVCTEAGVEVATYHASARQYALLDYHAVITQALDEHPACDGIFATADLIAAQVIQVCHRRGIRIPHDLKLVGFDDIPLAELVSPTLTTIRQPIDEIVTAAINAMENINDGQKTVHNMLLPVTLVERESTASV